MAIYGALYVTPKGGSKAGNIDYWKLDKRVEKQTIFEMKGLILPEIPGRKQPASDYCTVYTLKNGLLLVKYGFRYMLIARNWPIFYKTLRSLGVSRKSVETFSDGY